MSELVPIVHTDGDLAVIDPDTGEAVTLHQASDRTLAWAAEKIAEAEASLFLPKCALAAELRMRHGVGTTKAGGYAFQIAENTSWPVGATAEALERLLALGAVTAGDVARCMPSKPKPDARALKALAGRLSVTNPDAARVLAQACTVSPPSVRDVHPEAVDTTEEAA